jgi:hypothetical protein
VNDGPKTDPIRLAEEAQRDAEALYRWGDEKPLTLDRPSTLAKRLEALAHALKEAHEENETLREGYKRANEQEVRLWRLLEEKDALVEELEGALRPRSRVPEYNLGDGLVVLTSEELTEEEKQELREYFSWWKENIKSKDPAQPIDEEGKGCFPKD